VVNLQVALRKSALIFGSGRLFLRRIVEILIEKEALHNFLHIKKTCNNHVFSPSDEK